MYSRKYHLIALIFTLSVVFLNTYTRRRRRKKLIRQKIRNIRHKCKSSKCSISPDARHTSNTKANTTKANTIEANTIEVPESHILQLYQMAKDTHEIFVKHNLEYWISAGTLLGAVRHRGIIPWDDDLDMQIPLHQKELLYSLEPEFNNLGYELFEVHYGFKVFPKSGKYYQKCEFKYPYLDIFFMTERNRKIYYYDFDGAGHREGEPLFFTKDEIYPIQEYTFGQITLHGPNNPINYLNYKYGNDWNQIAIQSNHFSDISEKIKLTDKDREAAQPTGPLEDRVN